MQPVHVVVPPLAIGKHRVCSQGHPTTSSRETSCVSGADAKILQPHTCSSYSQIASPPDLHLPCPNALTSNCSKGRPGDLANSHIPTETSVWTPAWMAYNGYAYHTMPLWQPNCKLQYTLQSTWCCVAWPHKMRAEPVTFVGHTIQSCVTLHVFHLQVLVLLSILVLFFLQPSYQSYSSPNAEPMQPANFLYKAENEQVNLCNLCVQFASQFIDMLLNIVVSKWQSFMYVCVSSCLCMSMFRHEACTAC